jgi:hypothetical protein
MTKVLSILSILTLSITAYPSTFVGNGGNAGDVELKVTQNQIIEVFEYISKEDKKSLELCKCNEVLEGHGTCEILNQLNDEQRKFCGDFIVSKASEILSLMKNNQVQFRWTHEDIDVKESYGLRAADAVTNKKLNEITLNKKRFIELKSYERLFLLGHEVFHLLDHNGKPIVDEQEIGPFKGKEGGRQLLNSIGAALAVESFDAGINQKYQAPLTRSRARKNWWIMGSWGSSQVSERNSTFNMDKFKSSNYMGRYDFENVGVYLGITNLTGEKSIMNTIKATETRSILEYGITYKLIPFSDPLSFLGQSHFVFNLGGLSVNSQYQLKDNSLDETEKSVSNGWTAGCSYFMPFKNGAWIFAGGSIMNYNNSFTFGSAGSTVEYNKPHARTHIGAAYGF